MELLQQPFYYKVRHGLLQIETGITKRNEFITNCDRYYKVRWLLQIATVQGAHPSLRWPAYSVLKFVYVTSHLRRALLSGAPLPPPP